MAQYNDPHHFITFKTTLVLSFINKRIAGFPVYDTLTLI